MPHLLGASRDSRCLGLSALRKVCQTWGINAFITTDWAPDLAGLWASLTTPATPVDVSLPIMLAVLLVAAVLSVPRATWRWFGLFTTLVHELGHAVAAVLTGRVVHGIRIRRNHSGEAVSSGRGGFGSTVSGLFGYPAPAIVGAAQLWCVFNGYTSLALLIGSVVLLVTLLVIRNLFGLLVVLGSAAAGVALWFYAGPEVQSYTLLVIGASLLVGAVRGLATVIDVHVRRRTRLASSDAYLLAVRTGVPSVVWLTLFAIMIGGCLVFAFSAYPVA